MVTFELKFQKRNLSKKAKNKKKKEEEKNRNIFYFKKNKLLIKTKNFYIIY